MHTKPSLLIRKRIKTLDNISVVSQKKLFLAFYWKSYEFMHQIMPLVSRALVGSISIPFSPFFFMSFVCFLSKAGLQGVKPMRVNNMGTAMSAWMSPRATIITKKGRGKGHCSQCYIRMKFLVHESIHIIVFTILHHDIVQHIATKLFSQKQRDILWMKIIRYGCPECSMAVCML